jgi:hypothetical protein
MKTSLSFRLNTAAWVVAILVSLIPLFGGKPAEQFTGNLIATLFWMAVYYLFFIWIAPELLLRKKLVAFFGVSVIVMLVLPFIGYSLLFLSRALFNGDFSNFYNGYSLSMHMSGFKAMVFAGVTGSFFSLITDHFGK